MIISLLFINSIGGLTNMFMDYVFNVFFNQYFLLFLTAALGYLLGKVKIKSFTLGSTAAFSQVY